MENNNDKKASVSIAGVLLVIGVALITYILLYISRLKGFPQEYSAPDYNHSFPIILLWIIAIIGIGCMFFICFRKNLRSPVAFVFATIGTVVILFSVFNTMSKKEYFYFDEKYHCWCQKNCFRVTTAYPSGFEYYPSDFTIFGNMLLIQDDSTKTRVKVKGISFIQDPTIYGKDGKKTTQPFVRSFDNSCTAAMFCEDTVNMKMGILNGEGDVIVKPGQYQEINRNMFRGHISVKNEGKWGLINLKGDLVIPCKYESLNGVAFGQSMNYYFDGGYLMAFLSENEFEMADTLGNTISYEEYHNKYPNTTIKKQDDRFLIDASFSSDNAQIEIINGDLSE